MAWLSVAIFLLTAALPASAADGEALPPLGPPFPAPDTPKPGPPKLEAKLSSALRAVVGDEQQDLPNFGPTINADTSPPGRAAQIQAWFATGLLRERGGRLQVYIHVDELTDGIRRALVRHGAVVEIEAEKEGIVQASVPYGMIVAISELSGIRKVTEPSYGYLKAGSNNTQGDAVLNYDDLRALQGLDGTGVTVGVISDGIAGLANAVASGDLPATAEVRSNGMLTSTSGGVIATSFRADGDLEGSLGGSAGAEGTAMLEIVHDIAPGAQLRFANFSTSVEFNAAVDFLAGVSDVVVDDIGWLGRPTDGTSDVSTNTSDALTAAENPIRAYFTSVGNGAQEHYEQTFNHGAADFHIFTPDASTTTDAFGLGSSEFNLIALAPGQTAVLWLVWDDTFGSAMSDFDLWLVDDATATTVAASLADNIAEGDPLEVIVFTNPTGTSNLYRVYIEYWAGTTDHVLELMMSAGGLLLPNDALFNFNTTAGSVGAQSDAGGGVISVGAINASDSGADTIASYSSRGPTGDGRTKPDITAIDGVDVSGSGGFSDPFFGTSAAAPHMAGLAALLLQFRPDLRAGEDGDNPIADRSMLRAAILNGAVDLGSAGVDNTFGYGRADGTGAAAQLFAAPVITSAPGDILGVEGATVTTDTIGFSDLNSTDTHQGAVDWGDGSDLSFGATDTSTSFLRTYAYSDNGSFAATASVSDDEGLFSGAAPFTVDIINATPVVDVIAANITVQGGTPFTVDLATFSDAGSSDTHTATIDWGDGTIEAGTVSQGDRLVSGTHAYATQGISRSP